MQARTVLMAQAEGAAMNIRNNSINLEQLFADAEIINNLIAEGLVEPNPTGTGWVLTKKGRRVWKKIGASRLDKSPASESSEPWNVVLPGLIIRVAAPEENTVVVSVEQRFVDKPEGFYFLNISAQISIALIPSSDQADPAQQYCRFN
jgi:hypothetical protein